MEDFAAWAEAVAETARGAARRGWALATSGNFSAVTSREPLRLAITSSGRDKAAISAGEIVEVDAAGRRCGGSGTPSAETRIHLAIVEALGAGAVTHTHSVWSTLVSGAGGDGVWIEGYEMLKGLRGVTSHDHRERLPIVENTQDWEAAAPQVVELLRSQPALHGFLIRRHGLYTWGHDLAEARRHMEALEFLLEVVGRSEGHGGARWRS